MENIRDKSVNAVICRLLQIYFLGALFLIGKAASVMAGEATLSWQSNAESDLAGYKVYVGTASRVYSAPINVNKLTTYTVTGLNPATYYFAVTAYDTAGNESAFSAEATKTIAATTDTTPPSISGISAGNITTSGAVISWNTNESSDTQVQYGTTTSYGSTTALNSTLETLHSRTVTGLSPSTLYHYRVLSRDAAGNLAASSDQTFTTVSSAPSGDTLPPTISGISVSGITGSSGTVSWLTNEAASTQVQYGTTSAYGLSTPLNASLSTGHSQTLSGLSPSTTYHYRVISRDAAGNQAVSANQIFTTTAASSSAPAFQQGADGTVSLEAERYHAKVDQGGYAWAPTTTPAGYSGGGAMVATPNNGTNVNTGFSAGSPRLDFRVNFVKTGVHYVSIRGLGTSGNDDSIHVGLDGVAVDTADRISDFYPYNQWIWSKTTMDGVIATINVASTGMHILSVWMREDGFIFDKLVLATSATYAASGLGPAESILTTTAVGSSAPAFEQGADGLVSFEAERYHGKVDQGGHAWASTTTPAGYSGSGAMVATPNTNAKIDTGFSIGSPRLDFRVNFVKTGVHYVWIRGFGTSGNDDSIHVGLDGAELPSSDRIIFSPWGSWSWSQTTLDASGDVQTIVATINVASTGMHIVNVWMREDGFVVDKLVLATSASYIPSGTGPAESASTTVQMKSFLPPTDLTEFQPPSSDGFQSLEEASAASAGGCGMISPNQGNPPGPGEAADMMVITAVILLVLIRKKMKRYQATDFFTPAQE